MARTEVFIRDTDGETRLWRTDLTGHGVVSVGEEFTAREVEQYGRPHQSKGVMNDERKFNVVFDPERGYEVAK